MESVGLPTIERWFAAQGTPAQIDLARSGAPGLNLAGFLALAGISIDHLLSTSLDYGPGDGDGRLRQAIAAAGGAHAAEDVLITHGAIEALLLTCLAVERTPEGRVVVAGPAYSGLLTVPVTAGHRVECVEIWTPAEGLVVDRFIAALDETTDMALINSPHNPSGAQIPLPDIERIAQRCASLGVPLVIDEVSRATLDPGAPSAAACESFRLGQTVVIGDISKSMGLGGLRVGWLATTNHMLFDAASAAKDNTTVSCGPFTQRLATIALENARPFLGRVHQAAMRNRTELNRMVASAGGSWVAPVDGLVGFLSLPCRAGADRLARDLLAHDVSVVPGSLFGWPRHMRLGLGCSPATFAEGLDRITMLLAERS